MIQTRSSGSFMLVMVACLCSFSAAAFGYTVPDVKRGEDMVAGKDYKGAIELLSGITKDYEFCAANPTDAAKAGMLLCDAYEANGDQKSDAYGGASDCTKAALIQVWAGLKRQEPDIGKRFEKIARICTGHPQALAEFLKTVFGGLFDATFKTDPRFLLDVVFKLYEETLASAQHGNRMPDADLLYLLAERFHRLADSKRVIEVLDNVPETIPAERRDLRTNVLHLLTRSYFFARDCDNAVLCGRQLVALNPDAETRRNAEVYIAWSLEKAGRLEESAELMRSVAAGEDKPEARARRLADIGDMYYRAKKYDLAIQAFRAALGDPAAGRSLEARVRYGIGLCHRDMGLIDAATADMDAVIKLADNGEWAGLARGQLLELSAKKK